SKDRKNAELTIADDMLIYGAETGTSPDFGEKDAERERFLNIFLELYSSGHQLMIAHFNSPGSPGIKDEGILDKDIINKLQEPNKVYDLSRQVAEFNKPGTFWQKFGPRIRRYSMIAAIVLVALTSIALMASGIFSPIGIIGAVIAAKLGFAAAFVGGAVNIAAAGAGAATLVLVACKIRDWIENIRHSRYTFANQIAAANPKSSAKQIHSSSGINTGKIFEELNQDTYSPKSRPATPPSSTDKSDSDEEHDATETNPLVPPSSKPPSSTL
ncbi:MAG TPA: hypothetical protein VHA13_00770, partial [Gammaproteobacteria bacterium]|nr:hypothetical protein [Gammaproteobacteria bacterium]